MSESFTESKQGNQPSESNESHQPQQHHDDPEKGIAAWLGVLGAFLVYTASWGFLSTYGSYQKYYETTFLKDVSPSAIAWIGTLEGVILIMGGAVTGPIYDRGYIRELLIAGTFFTVFGIMMLSLAETFYQVLLAQGICVGIGGALLYVPSISMVATTFTKRRTLAVFLTSSGNAVGGIVYPVMFVSLQPKIGFAWTTRVLGFLTLGVLVAAIVLMRSLGQPKMPQEPRPLLDMTAFRDPVFMVYCVALFFMWIAYWVPFFLLPTFAQFKAGASSDLAFYVLVICNASTIIGRYMAVPLTKQISSAAGMGFLSLVTSILLFAWTGVHSIAATIVWSVFIAIFIAPLSVVYPVLIHELTPDKRLVGNRMGISSFAAALGTLIGFPVTAALNDIEAGIFWKSQVFNGICILIGALLMVYVYLKTRQPKEEKTAQIAV